MTKVKITLYLYYINEKKIEKLILLLHHQVWKKTKNSQSHQVKKKMHFNFFGIKWPTSGICTIRKKVKHWLFYCIELNKMFEHHLDFLTQCLKCKEKFVNTNRVSKYKFNWTNAHTLLSVYARLVFNVLICVQNVHYKIVYLFFKFISKNIQYYFNFFIGNGIGNGWINNFLTFFQIYLKTNVYHTFEIHFKNVFYNFKEKKKKV